MRHLKTIQITLAILLTGLFWPAPSDAATTHLDVDDSAAVILAYHRIDEDIYPGNSLRLERFLEHVREIEHGDYNVMPLPDIIKAMKSGEPLPPKTIAITFEGGYQSAHQRAMPILLKSRHPFTVFYSSYNTDRDSGEYIGWRDLKALARYDFVSIGILPAAYSHFRNQSLEENKRYTTNARLEYRKHFGNDPELFAYAFGEYSLEYKNWITRQGFNAAFGLQSGVAHKKMDFFNVPRFVMTEGFGDIERFRMITSALPVPAYDIEPAGHYIRTDNPLFGFSVPENLGFVLEATQCFISSQGEAETLKIGTNRLEIRPTAPLGDDKVRLNCTANTGTAAEPQWRWFGLMYSLDLPSPSAQSGKYQDALETPQSQTTSGLQE